MSFAARKRRHMLRIAVCLLVAIGTSGCRPDDEFAPESSAGNSQDELRKLTDCYEATLSHIRATHPQVAEFRALFPEADESISWFARDSGQRYSARSLVYARYVIAIDFPIEIDKTRCTAAAMEAPKFYFHERSRVVDYGSQQDISYVFDGQRIEGVDGWTRFFKSGGDLSVLGYKVNTTPLVPERR